MTSLAHLDAIGSIKNVEIRFSEVIGALSYALDLTEGQPQGHAARSCYFGMRLARELKLPLDQSAALFYALLMKDLGCSTNASKMCFLFGADDRKVKGGIKTVNWSSMPSALAYAAGAVAPEGSLLQKAGRLAKVALAGPKGARELIELRVRARGEDCARAAFSRGDGGSDSLAGRTLGRAWASGRFARGCHSTAGADSRAGADGGGFRARRESKRPMKWRTSAAAHGSIRNWCRR